MKQVPEQYDAEPPSEIDCVVRISERGTFIEQDYASLIRQHYDVGQEQIFDIVRVNRDNYELRDAWGLYRLCRERICGRHFYHVKGAMHGGVHHR